MKIRTTKTKPGKTAVQIINFFKRKTNVIKHIGSSGTKEGIAILMDQAHIWIENEASTKGLFRTEDHFHRHYQYLGFSYTYAYEFLEKMCIKFNFHNHLSPLFKDLIIARILEPGSKRNSLEFLETFLNKTHSENVLYKSIVKYSDAKKDAVEKEIVSIAQQDFGFDFSFVLYDVTTLYFESFKNDEFKTAGFSKDHKHNQPQIVIGLIVTKEGFPISYQIFKGNVFEGNTFMHSLLSFRNKHHIKSLTVVADAAMLSRKNITELVAHKLNYILASRLANLKLSLINQIDKDIARVDGSSVRMDSLVVDYSSKRYRKDKAELDKQIKKAESYLNSETEKITNIKYLKNDKVTRYLNQDLIDKNTKLLGLKGYVTNLDIPNQEIITHYHNLFRVEHAFRIAKSDLEARPIFHHKEASIKNHILICFLALTISVYLELKNKKSIASIISILKSITDGKILDKIANKILFERVPSNDQVKELEKLSY